MNGCFVLHVKRKQSLGSMKRPIAPIVDFFVPVLQGIEVTGVWFPKYGASCDTSHATIDLLYHRFDESLISRNGELNSVPRKCNLTILCARKLFQSNEYL